MNHQYNWCMQNKNEILSLLNKIRKNTEYLSLVEHRSQFNINITKFDPSGKEVCPISVSKMIVQMVYLLYTCSLLKVDLYLSDTPIFTRKYQSNALQPKLVFYLMIEQQQNFHQNLGNIFQYIPIQAFKFNQIIVELIPMFYAKLQHYLIDKSPEQETSHSNMKKLLEIVTKSIAPKVLDDSSYPSIKQLERTALFSKGSDLILAFKCSCYYKIRKKQMLIEIFKNTKQSFKTKLAYNLLSTGYIYKQLDKFLMELVNFEILHMEKSTTKEDKKSINYQVGHVSKEMQNGKGMEKYFARFFTFDREYSQGAQNMQETKNGDKNIYSLQYCPQTSLMCLIYITFVEANVQTIDIITAYSSNISFQDTRVSIQTIDIIRSPNKVFATKKYIGFKAFYRVYQTEEPFSKFLLLIEHLTISAKIYLELIIKKPNKNQILETKQSMNRADHLVNLFIGRADAFYRNL